MPAADSTREQLVARRRDRAAERDPRRVVEVHERRDHLADQLGGLAHQAKHGRIAPRDEGANVRDADLRPALLPEPAGDRARGGQRLDAADVAADAPHVRAAAQ